MANNKIVVSNEVLSDVIKKVNVLTGTDNKVRFKIGINDTGNGLQSMAMIVSGGAMITVGFTTLKPKKELESKIDFMNPFMSFILKAQDFVTYAGALLPYKADVTLTEEAEKVIFSVGDGTKVPVGKVSAETAEPLLEDDSTSKIAKIIGGEKMLEAFERGGYSATQSSTYDKVNVKVENNTMIVGSTMGTALSVFRCDVDVEWGEKQADGTPAVDVATFLKEYVKSLDAEKREEFKSELQQASNDPAKVRELAAGLGWKDPAATAAVGTSQNGSLTFALNAVNYKLLTKLYSGAKTVKMIVTPKNVHVLAGLVKATFARSDEIAMMWSVKERMERTNVISKVVMDRDALLGTIAILKLGEKKRCDFKANKTSLSFAKAETGIVSRVQFVSSDGDLSATAGSLDYEMLGSYVGALKAGNVVFGFGGPCGPHYVYNGTLDSDITSFHAFMGLKHNGESAFGAEGTEEE